MYSNEELQVMTPKMSIKYFTEGFSFAQVGNFEEIPENAVGANITTTFPIVGANGEFMLSSSSYDMFVGEVVNIDALIYASEPTELKNLSAEKLKYLKSNGVKELVSTELGYVPYRYGDGVFSVREEFVEGISKIKQTFDSVDFVIQNQDAPKQNR